MARMWAGGEQMVPDGIRTHRSDQVGMATVNLTPNPVSTGTSITVIATDLSWEASGAAVRSALFGDAERWHEMELQQEWDRRTGTASVFVPLAIVPGSHRVEVSQRWRDGAHEEYHATAAAEAGEFSASFTIRFTNWTTAPEFEWVWNSNDPLATGRRWMHGWQPVALNAGSGRGRGRLQVAYGIENGKELTAKLELTSSTGVTRALEHQVTCPPRPAAATEIAELVEVAAARV
jgi:hypothetical protein